MLRFSVRDLFWLTAVIGLTFGLIVNWSALAKRQRLLDEQTKRADQLASDLRRTLLANEQINKRVQQMTQMKAVHDALNSVRPAKDQHGPPQIPDSN
jgi:hypothetical protein